MFPQNKLCLVSRLIAASSKHVKIAQCFNFGQDLNKLVYDTLLQEEEGVLEKGQVE